MKKYYRKLIPHRDTEYYEKIGEELRGMLSVLDVGCGENSPIRNIKKTFFSTGVDLSESAIKKSSDRGIHDQYLVSNILDIDTLFEKKSFDAVIALDVIEHLTKEDGLSLIEKMESLARKKIIISTPNGFVEQFVEKEPLQEHLSGWDCKEMKGLGYTCIGMNGIKYIPRERGAITISPSRIWGLVADFMQPLIYHVPQIAFQLLCIKTYEDINGQQK